LDSPDTSPDSESAQTDVPPPKDLQPSAQQQRENEEHDRLLAAQKEIARQEALGDVAATPDDQLKWEEREAAAREAEERAAREDGKGPEPDGKDANELTEAGQVVEDIEADAAAQPANMDVDAKLHMPDQTDRAVQDGQQEEDAKEVDTEMQDDGDTIAVASAPRVKAPLHINTSSRRSSPEKQPTPATSRREGMTTRVSSGVLRQKSVSEILGNSQSGDFSPIVRKSSEAMSPLTRRHPSDVAGNLSIEPMLPPQHTAQATRPTRSSTHQRTASTLESAMDQLLSLKGAAEDPERDYLEPLFRIQAYDAPNARTRALPDLVKMGSKTLATEDHYTALHERLDFRMLRRIYQLQNANKWSLRQMQKCKEPVQPVSHHDRMMAEMKWMRKDFKAERKTKMKTCAFLAERCAEWVAADAEEKKMMQVKVKPHQPEHAKHVVESAVPDLEHAGDSAAEDEGAPPTPRASSPIRTTLVVAPELAGAVEELRKTGELSEALKSLPRLDWEPKEPRKVRPTAVSRFIEGKVLPKASGPARKRSRFEYEDEAEVLEVQPQLKRMREEISPEVSDCALFQADNKPIRDRLHSNNAFRPPSEFLMPSIAFYESRHGSQWIWEDDQKLRKLAKEYSFNWSLIADEMALPTRYKTSADRRTPWECFERWVELESLPADMRKTVYFKTWFSRLEVSQQTSEKKYQAHVASIQQQASQTGTATHIPPRRRTIPTRVEKRRSTRYLWMVEGFRKNAKKREQAAWKQAETARAAAQRKSQTETPVANKVKMTPQEFSKKRQERDLQMAEMARQQRAKQIEHQQRALQLARQQAQQQPQQGMPNGGAHQQRPPGVPMQPGALQPSGPQAANVNGMAGQQARAAVRNGPLAPQVNGQGIPQAQMQARIGPNPHPNMQMARNPQYSAQQFQMANGSISSPGGMSTQQQQLAAAYPQQQSQPSPSMPPPPTPQNGAQGAQQLSSGTTPVINTIKAQLRAQNPNMAQDQLDQLANQQLAKHMTNRQSAMNAAAGIPVQGNNAMQQQFPHNQAAYQGSRQMQSNGLYANVNGGGSGEGNGPTPSMNPPSTSPQAQQHQAYKQQMQQQQYSAMRMQQMQMQSPNQAHVSPAMSHPSPNMAATNMAALPASPSMQYPPNMGPSMMNGQTQQQRPTSRSNTPQMQRVGSSGSGINGGGMQSPNGGLQGSPRNMQAGMTRS
jgi:chromatin modification-related protein VID21